ncbi:hypothetical protein ES703_102981 [subsurface metagenome]
MNNVTNLKSNVEAALNKTRLTQAEARSLFAQIPTGVRNKLLDMDYNLAEARCPQRMPIRELVTEAVSKLA